MSMGLGQRIAPPRFIAFVVLLAAGAAALVPRLGWTHGLLLGFDGAALLFLLSLVPLFRQDEARQMRARSRENDANRVVLLVLTGAVMLVVLTAIALELTSGGKLKAGGITLVLATLALAWTFSNVVYALHYAHLYYLADENTGKDGAGIDFPGTEEPDYWDFLYFSCTLGMTFQTSDCDIEAAHMRKVALFHCLAAFVFNLGVLAFSINILGSAGK
jgi:uncharacterized membrane protein